jgi:hypothetical protein
VKLCFVAVWIFVSMNESPIIRVRVWTLRLKHVHYESQSGPIVLQMGAGHRVCSSRNNKAMLLETGARLFGGRTAKWLFVRCVIGDCDRLAKPQFEALLPCPDGESYVETSSCEEQKRSRNVWLERWRSVSTKEVV